MAYAISSASEGTFVGEALGLIFFSKTETAGQFVVATCDSEAEAKELIAAIKGISPSFADLTPVEVKSGHWRDLQASGLDIGNMAENELRFHYETTQPETLH